MIIKVIPLLGLLHLVASSSAVISDHDSPASTSCSNIWPLSLFSSSQHEFDQLREEESIKSLLEPIESNDSYFEVNEYMEKIAKEAGSGDFRDPRFKLLVSKASEQLSNDKIIPMMENPFFARLMLKTDDVDKFSYLFPHSVACTLKETALIPVVAKHHSTLFPVFSEYLQKEYIYPLYNSIIQEYIEALIIRSATEDHLLQVIQSFQDFKPSLFSNQDIYNTLTKISKLQTSSHQMALLKVFLSLSAANPVDMFQMPLMILDDPPKWISLSHSWPHVFFKRRFGSNELWVPTNLEKEIIRKSYSLGSVEISKKIFDLSPIYL